MLTAILRATRANIQQRLWASVTSGTGDVAVDIAADKELTNRFLGNVGLPVPRAYNAERVVCACALHSLSLSCGSPVNERPARDLCAIISRRPIVLSRFPAEKA